MPYTKCYVSKVSRLSASNVANDTAAKGLSL